MIPKVSAETPGTVERRISRCMPDIVALLVLILIGGIYTYGIEQFLDIILYDESSYLRRGIFIPKRLPNPEYAPLYAVWYYLLSLIKPDTIELYYFNYKAMTVLPAVMLFFVLRTYRVLRILAFVLSFGLIYSAANFPVWPKVSHFAAILLLLGFLTARFFHNSNAITAIFTVTALLVSYARPEFFVSFVVLAHIFVFLTYRSILRRCLVKAVVPLIIVGTLSAGLIQAFGIPLKKDSRSMVAFGQHYALSLAVWDNDKRYPWSHWRTLIEKDFGAAQSVTEAVMINPAAVARHCLQNLSILPAHFLWLFSAAYPPNDLAKIAFRLGMFIILIAAVMRVRNLGLKALFKKMLQNLKRLFFWAMLTTTLLLPVAISVILIYPRQHYLLLAGTIVITTGTILLFRNTDQSRWDNRWMSLAALCLLSVLIARPLSLECEAVQPNLTVIRFLRALDIKAPINVLEADGGYDTYLGPNYKRHVEYKKTKPFGIFLKEQSINMIVLSDRISEDDRFCDDPDWHAFVNDPTAWGFTHIEIPGVERRSLFLKKDIAELM